MEYERTPNDLHKMFGRLYASLHETHGKKSNECDINKGKNTYKYTFKSIRDVGGKSLTSVSFQKQSSVSKGVIDSR